MSVFMGVSVGCWVSFVAGGLCLDLLKLSGINQLDRFPKSSAYMVLTVNIGGSPRTHLVRIATTAVRLACYGVTFVNPCFLAAIVVDFAGLEV
jgi:hypothetical protein